MKRFFTTAFMLSLSQVAIAEAGAVDVPEEAKAAVAIVDRFFASLSSGNLDQAGGLLAPEVVILESGGAEHSAAEYLGNHARADAEYLKGARQTLKRRTARIAGNAVWVATESELETLKDGKPAVADSTETMVLRSTDSGWKIVHIHWSSRTKSR